MPSTLNSLGLSVLCQKQPHGSLAQDGMPYPTPPFSEGGETFAELVGLLLKG